MEDDVLDGRETNGTRHNSLEVQNGNASCVVGVVRDLMPYEKACVEAGRVDSRVRGRALEHLSLDRRGSDQTMEGAYGQQPNRDNQE